MRLYEQHIIYILLLMTISINLFGQSHTDSLEAILNRTTAEEKVDIYLQLGEEYLASNPDKALDYGLQALVQAKRQNKTLQEASALWLLGKANFSIGNLVNAVRYLNRTLNLFEKLNKKTEQIQVLIELANVHDFARNPEMAIQFLERARTSSIQVRDKRLQIEVLINLGQIYIKQGNNKLALNQFSKVLELIGEKNLNVSDINTKSVCYSKMGLSYKNLGELDKSHEFYRKAFQLTSNLNDSVRLVSNIREMALSFYLLQQMDSSLFYYNKAFNTSKMISDSIGMLNCLEGIGDVYFETKDFSLANNSYNRQLDLANAIKFDQGAVTSLVKIARCNYATGNYPLATHYLNRALLIAKKKNLLSSAADVYQYLSLISEAEGRYKDALGFHKLWADLRDSIYNEESGEKLAKLQILYDISQKERENEILRQSSEIQNLQLSKTNYQRFILIAVATTFLVLLVFLFLLYQSNRKEIRKQKDTEQRIVELNKELERRMILEIKKQEKQQHLLAQKSKLESMGTLVAGLAHEINQPLGGISMGLDNILLKTQDHNLTDEYLKDKVQLLFDNVDRIKRIIDQVRIFSRAQKPLAFEQIDINEVISRTLLMVENQYTNNEVVIEKAFALNPCFVTADKFKLEQVVLNLLSNAKHAVDERKRKESETDYQKVIEIKTWLTESYACFSVRDNGIGIHSDIIEKIYDPFFTTKSEDKGTGLGLAIAYGLIKDILGEIRVESEEGKFTQFEVIIPKS